MKKAKILLVDDDLLFLSLTRKALKGVRYLKTIKCISSAKEAREYLDSCVEKGLPFPDAIFLDINMPGIGGMDFADLYSHRYAEQFPNTKLMILTLSNNLKDKVKALEIPGVRAYVQKPLTEDKLNRLLF